MPSRQPRVPSIGFASRQNSDAFSSFVSASLEALLGLLDDQLLVIGQELVQRRVEQPHGDGQAVHRVEDADEVGFLLRAQLLERGVFVGFVVGEDHALHDRQPVAEEHVLGAAQADALGAELAGALRVFGEIGVRAHPQAPVADRPNRGSCRSGRWARA